MATKYVSSSNLAYFYGKIKTSIDSKLDASKAYKHPNSGVTAGTYRSVTVNAQGHVTAGTNPTTLAGYGITDAAAKNHSHNYAGSASAGGAANSVAKPIIVKLNGGSTEGRNLFTFNGSAGKTINITPGAIGAAAKNHTHNYAGSGSAGGSANSAVKLATARTITLGGDLSGSASFDGSANITISASVTAMTNTEIDKLFA